MTLYSPRLAVNIKQNKIAVVKVGVLAKFDSKSLLKIQKYPSVDDFEGKSRKTNFAYK